MAASGLTFASGANFTAQAANPANTLTTGTLAIDDGNPNAAVLSAGGMRPGDSATGRVDIANAGTLSGAFTLERGAPDDNDHSQVVVRTTAGESLQRSRTYRACR